MQLQMSSLKKWHSPIFVTDPRPDEIVDGEVVSSFDFQSCLSSWFFKKHSELQVGFSKKHQF